MRIDYLLIPLGAFAFIVGLTTLVGTLLGAADWWLAVSIVMLVLSWEFTIGHIKRRRETALATTLVVTNRRVKRTRSNSRGQLETLVQELGPGVEVRAKPQYDGRGTIRVGRVTLFNIDGYARVETLIRQQLPSQSK